MAIIDINLNPSKTDLKWFGLILFALFGLIGGLVWWHSESFFAPVILWSIGSVLCAAYYAFRPFRRPMFIGWMRAMYPVGWTVSHVILGTTYYLVLTPIGLLTRLFGSDEIQQRFDPDATSYWVEQRSERGTDRYLGQF